MGDYRIIQEIGKGGMGYVYEARHIRLDMPVALKVISTGESASEADVQRFLIEAQAVAALHRHPNIVKIHHIGQEEHQQYFVMQLVRGGSLSNRLGEFKDNPRQAVELMVKVAHAISHAHRRGILHRDLKPDNVLIDEEGTPYVTDFGLAKRVDPTEPSMMTIGPNRGAARAAPTGRREGPAPGVREQRDRGGDDPRDPVVHAARAGAGQGQGRLHALRRVQPGGTLFAILCGRAPFLGRNVRHVLDQVIADPPPSPKGLNKAVDPDLDAVCLKCLAKDPKQRYESADAFARGPQPLARRQSGPRPAALPPRAGVPLGQARAPEGGDGRPAGDPPAAVRPHRVGREGQRRQRPQGPALRRPAGRLREGSWFRQETGPGRGSRLGPDPE